MIVKMRSERFTLILDANIARDTDTWRGSVPEKVKGKVWKKEKGKVKERGTVKEKGNLKARVVLGKEAKEAREAKEVVWETREVAKDLGTKGLVGGVSGLGTRLRSAR